MTEHEYLEDNIATLAFHLGRPGARLSVQNGMPGLVVDPGEVLKEVSRRLNSHEALVKALERIASETTQWDWETSDGPNALVKILLQMRVEAREALALVGTGKQP